MNKPPCHDCPFLRTVEPGALGGSSPMSYIGQAHSTFLLPCHSEYAGRDPVAEVMSIPPCRGAMLYRANVQAALPPTIPVAEEPDVNLAFASAAEFLAHHTGESVRGCELYLMSLGIKYMAAWETKIGVGLGRVHLIPREGA